ncbi:MAG: polyketide cyclase, partial [Ilumatobacteraceae bacterium]
MAERFEVHRLIPASPDVIFKVLCDPAGHVAIDSTGMLMSSTGGPVAAVGDSFVVHM